MGQGAKDVEVGEHDSERQATGTVEKTNLLRPLGPLGCSLRLVERLLCVMRVIALKPGRLRGLSKAAVCRRLLWQMQRRARRVSALTPGQLLSMRGVLVAAWASSAKGSS